MNMGERKHYINKSICVSIVNVQKSLFCLAKDIFSVVLYLYSFLMSGS